MKKIMETYNDYWSSFEEYLDSLSEIEVTTLNVWNAVHSDVKVKFILREENRERFITFSQYIGIENEQINQLMEGRNEKQFIVFE